MKKLETCFMKTIGFGVRLAEAVGLISLLRSRNNKKIIILMYHGITASHNPITNFDQKHIETARFEEQIIYLKKHYTIISLNYYIEWKNHTKSLPSNPVILTFDDAYKNNYTRLLSILKKHNVPATIFLPTANINQQEIGWYDTIAYCISQTKKKEVRIIGKIYPLQNEKQKIAAVFEIKTKLPFCVSERNKLLKKIIHETEIDPKECTDEDLMFLTWKQCKEMLDAGISFGSHTVNHPHLSALNEEEMQIEMEQSKKDIEKNLKNPCIFFSYPFGEHNIKARNMLKKTGYMLGVTTTYGMNTKDTDSAALCRIPINNIYETPIFALNLTTNIISIIHYTIVLLYGKVRTGLKCIFNSNFEECD